MLVSVGSKGKYFRILELDNTDIVVEKGFIQVTEYYQTKETHIYAIGDCIGGLQLAHVASHEGITAVEHIADEILTQLILCNISTLYLFKSRSCKRGIN